jgi:subtilisin family serine protease
VNRSISHYRFLLSAITALVFLAACGREGDPQPLTHHQWDEPGLWAGPGVAGKSDPRPRRVPGSWIVAFRANASREALEFANFRSEVRFHHPPLASAYLGDPRVKSIDFITSADLSAPDVGGELRGIVTPSVAGPANPAAVAAIAKVDFRSDEEASAALAEWEAAGRLWFADPNGISELSSLATQDDSFANWATAYSSLESQIPHLKAIEVAVSLTKIGSKPVDSVPSNADILANPPLIAVIDSGVDYDHPQLKNRIFVNPSPGASGCDNDVRGCNVTAMGGGLLGDGNVYPNYTTGAGTACPSADREVEDKCNHGTHVAGIIAAEYSSNGSSVSGPAGVCPFCKIVPIKATGPEGGISDASQLAGLKYVSLFRSKSSNAIRVVNASFGQFQRNRAIAVIVASLRRTGNGIVVIAASGNEDTMLRSYPAALADVVAVSALDASNNKASFSNFGNWVDVAAPGTGIPSTVPGGSTLAKNGTSMAAPVVSGVAGLLIAWDGSLSAKNIKERLISTADPKIYSADTNLLNYQYYYARIAGEPVPRPLLGSGLVRADSALNGEATGAYTPDALQRVSPGCGRVAASEGVVNFDPGLLIALILPFVALISRVVASRRRRVADCRGND